MSQDFWIDHLAEKHECFGYQPRSEHLEIGGRQFELIVPSWVPRFEVVRASCEQDTMFLLLRDLETQGWDDSLGIVVVARQTADEQYAVVLWHGTFPYIWKHLGNNS